MPAAILLNLDGQTLWLQHSFVNFADILGHANTVTAVTKQVPMAVSELASQSAAHLRALILFASSCCSRYGLDYSITIPSSDCA